MPEEKVDGRVVARVAREIKHFLVQGAMAYYHLGERIYWVYETKAWKNWEGIEFRCGAEWCWVVLGFKESKAWALNSNYRRLTALGISDDDLPRAARLGWTKLAKVLQMVDDMDGLNHWLDRIEEERLTEVDLRRALAKHKAGLGQRGPAPAETETSGDGDGDSRQETEEDEESSQTQTSTASTKKKKNDEPRRVPWPFKLTFASDRGIDIFADAIKEIKRRLNKPEMPDGDAVALICTQYLATVPKMEEGGPVVELEQIIQAVEDNYGIRVEVVSGEPVGAL